MIDFFQNNGQKCVHCRDYSALGSRKKFRVHLMRGNQSIAPLPSPKGIQKPFSTVYPNHSQHHSPSRKPKIKNVLSKSHSLNVAFVVNHRVRPPKIKRIIAMQTRVPIRKSFNVKTMPRNHGAEWSPLTIHLN